MRDIRDNLRAVIEDRGITQAHIANRAGLTPAQLSGVIHKKRKLEANEMLEIFFALGITPDTLKITS